MIQALVYRMRETRMAGGKCRMRRPIAKSGEVNEKASRQLVVQGIKEVMPPRPPIDDQRLSPRFSIEMVSPFREYLRQCDPQVAAQSTAPSSLEPWCCRQRPGGSPWWRRNAAANA
jgi:hypothetical protein